MKTTRREALAGGIALAATAGLPGNAHAMNDVLDTHDSLGLAELVRMRKVSASELLEAAIARAEALNPQLNFMAQKHYDYARQVLATHRLDTRCAAVHFSPVLYLLLPQAWRPMIPALTNDLVTLTKNSSLLSVISVYELTRAGQAIPRPTSARRVSR